MVSPSKRKISKDQQAKMQAAHRAKRGVSAQGEDVADQQQAQLDNEELQRPEGSEQISNVRDNGATGEGAPRPQNESSNSFEQFQPAPEPDPFQQEDPLGGASATMPEIEAPPDMIETPLNPLPAATAAAEVGVDSIEPAVQATEEVEAVSRTNNEDSDVSDDSDDNEDSTLPEGFELAPGATKAAGRGPIARLSISSTRKSPSPSDVMAAT
ncbi:hypothetical protein KEM55_004386 [Ascosphaera atra]|nr:hypothetical protein KEM55_004386 [Ascosphaera atra]